MKKKIIYALLILLLVFTGGVFANIITLPIGLDVMKKGGEDSVLNADIVFNTTGETHQSSPLTLKEFGDPLSNEEYNRLVESLALSPSTYVPPSCISGGSGTLADPIMICDCTDLQNIGNGAFGSSGDSYELAGNIDCSSMSNFEPIGGAGDPFTGTLDGQGYTVSDITINHPGRALYTGIFSVLSGQNIRDLIIDNANVDGQAYVGVLAGTAIGGGDIFNVHTKNSSIDASGLNVGGLLGGANGNIVNGNIVIRQVSTEGSVTGGGVVGGLVGATGGGAEIRQSYSSADVTATSTSAAGLVAQADRLVVSDSYATGTITSDASYAGGAFAPIYTSPASVTNVYSIGQVNGNSSSGGFGPSPWPVVSVSNGFYDTDTSGRDATDSLDKGTPLTTSQMNQAASFTGWDFAGTWQIDEGNTYPCLQWQGGTDQCPVNTAVAIASCDNGGTPLATCSEFKGISDLTADYCLVDNIVCSLSDLTNQKGQFSGEIDGQGYFISGYNVPNDGAIFDKIQYGTIKNLTIQDSSFKTVRDSYVGAIANSSTGGTIENVVVKDSVIEYASTSSSLANMGGLIGYSNNTIFDKVGSENLDFVIGSSTNITGVNYHAGDRYAAGIGGIVGGGRANISESFADVMLNVVSGTIIGDRLGIGGIIGAAWSGSITNSYAVGSLASSITGDISFGGVIGIDVGASTELDVSNSYGAINLASSPTYRGGIVGRLFPSALVPNNITVYPMTSSQLFYDEDVVGQTLTTPTGEQKTSTEMQQQATFAGAGWDFSSTWQIDEGNTYPCLRWQGATDQCPSNN